ncbi:MAG: hypothetical protein ACRC10_13160 [Thermoguttaceae bacterium]
MLRLLVLLLMIGIPIGTGFWIAWYLKKKYHEQAAYFSNVSDMSPAGNFAEMPLKENSGTFEPVQPGAEQAGDVMNILKQTGLINSLTDKTL